MTNQEFSILSLGAHASLPVKAIIALLLLMSLLSWTNIILKIFNIRHVYIQTKYFERNFWSGGELQSLYQNALSKHQKTCALERIFESGMHEYLKLKEKGLTSNTSVILDGVRRAMRASYQRELDSLERNLAFLASVGSVSPYIGLFATVWGIMNAFRGLSNMQQATLVNVAPGISEALVATAIGLFTAIPAVIAYNLFVSSIDRISIRFNSFIDEFLNILQRQIH
ncbi:protein TolQ [Candidatus Pandoraea novymonadis]|nr:protein TolQ [Candidatus Pandoraea novymonadis]